MKFSKTWLAPVAIVLLLALAFALWYNTPSQRQARADAQLRNAILHNDTRGVMDALAQGANPNATYLFPSWHDQHLTLWQRAKNAYHHVPPEPPGALSPLALAILGDTGAGSMPPENPAIVESLLRRGANPNCTAYDAPLILDTACYDKAATINLLLRYGANVNARDSGGDTALTEAAQFEQCVVAETLLNHGVNVNNQGANGWTPLMGAVIDDSEINWDTRRLPMVRLLLRHHADVFARTDNGATALTIARRTARWPHQDQATLGAVIALLQAAQAKQKPAP